MKEFIKLFSQTFFDGNWFPTKITSGVKNLREKVNMDLKYFSVKELSLLWVNNKAEFLFLFFFILWSFTCAFIALYFQNYLQWYHSCTSALSISAAKIQNAAVLKFSVYEFCITLQKNRTFTHFMFPFLKGNGWMRQLPHIRSSLLSLHNLERGTMSWELFLYEWYKTNKQLNLRQTRRKQSVDGKCGMHCTLMYRSNSSNMSLK